MTLPLSFSPAEDVLQDFLKRSGSSVADLTGGYVFQGMPAKPPNPAVIISRVAGSPITGSETAIDQARISCSIYGRSKTEAKTIAYTLVSELESLFATGPYTATNGGTLQYSEIINISWLPDDQTARFIVDLYAYVIS